MQKCRVRGLVVLAMHCAAACAGMSTARDDARPDPAKYQAWRMTAAKSIAQREDASSIATAAALGYLGDSGHAEALDWAAQAAAHQPDDPALGWLRLELCAGTPGCDIRDAATTLRWIDADNGAAWLPSLTLAAHEKDTMEIDRILSEMASAKHFDLYWNRLVAMVFDVLRHERDNLPSGYISSDVARLSEAISVLSAESIPPFGALRSACHDAPASERRDRCLRLARVMQRGDAIVTQLAGLGIERRALPAEGREARAIAERQRTLLWRRAAANHLEATPLPWLKNSRARSLVSRMRAMPREEDVCIAVLRAHGISVEPPAGHR